MSFTTVDEVALFLNMDVDTLSDLELAQIEMTIPYVDGIINDYCGWNMLATDYTLKRFDGSGTNTLDLRMYPINTLTLAKVRAADGTFVDATVGIEILDDGILQFLPYATTETTSFTAGVKNWFLTFNAGFATGNIPHSLAYSANYLTSINFSKMTAGNIGELEEKVEGISIKSDLLELPVNVKRSLDRYRLVSIF